MEPIEKRIIVNATVSKVWKALTEPAELEKWLMMTTTFLPEKGKEASLPNAPASTNRSVKTRCGALISMSRLPF